MELWVHRGTKAGAVGRVLVAGAGGSHQSHVLAVSSRGHLWSEPCVRTGRGASWADSRGPGLPVGSGWGAGGAAIVPAWD